MRPSISLYARFTVSIKQSDAVIFSVVQATMNFHASLFLVIFNFSVSVTHPTFNNFVCPSNTFSHCFTLLHYPLPISVVTRCSSFSLLITWPKNVSWLSHISYLSDLVVLASLNTALSDLFAVKEIQNILLTCKNHISAVSNFLHNTK